LEVGRYIERENLFKKLAEIDKEEEVDNGENQKQKFLFDDEIDMNNKVKWKKHSGGMVFFDVIELIDLTKDEKLFMNQTENIIHLFC
jgi:hypothetical protein